LGRFSSQTTGRRRRGLLWVKSVSARDPYRRAAEKLAAQVGLYDVGDSSLGPGGTADIAWGYERYLQAALDTLADRDARLDGQLWARGAVLFLAGLFVRGPEFQDEFARRIAAISRDLRMDGASNAVAGRLIDFQLLLAPVLAARWTVLHFGPTVELITSDRGYALTSTPDGSEHAYVVPIDRHTALVVAPRSAGVPLFWREGSWSAQVEHRDAPDAEAPALNRAIAAFAIEAVFGSRRETVEAVAGQVGAAPRLSAGLFAGLDPVSHLYDYFRVLAALKVDPGEAAAAARGLDWSHISDADWTAPIIVELLFPERAKGGVSVGEGRIVVDLSYGIALREARREAKDPAMGALGMVDLSQLREGIGVPGAETAAAPRRSGVRGRLWRGLLGCRRSS